MAICRCTVGGVAIASDCARFEGARDDAERISQIAAESARQQLAPALCAAVIVGHHFDSFGATARHDRRARCTGAQSCGGI